MQPDIFIFSTPNVSLEDDEHLLHVSKYRYTQVQSHKPRLVSFHWEGIKEMRRRGQILRLNKYLHPTHYINNMTFTIYNHKRFVFKEGRTFFSGNAFFFFCNGSIIVIVSAFVLFIIRNIIVLLVGWWLVLMLLRLWLVVLALLGTEEVILRNRQLKSAAERSSRSH